MESKHAMKAAIKLPSLPDELDHTQKETVNVDSVDSYIWNASQASMKLPLGADCDDLLTSASDHQDSW